MPQTRIDNYGQTATSRWENLSLYATQRKGVYRGFDLALDLSGNLIINPGYFVVNSTVNTVEQLVVVWESTYVGLSSPALPAAATDYTVVATHDNREILGGVQVSYEVRTGLFGTVTDGTVIGWIFHPGGGVAITVDMLLSAPKEMSTEYADLSVMTKPVDILAPFYSRSYLETIGPNVTVTDPSWDPAAFIIFQLAENSGTAPGAELARQIIQFYTDTYRPASFDLYIKTDPAPQTFLTAEVFDTAQAPVIATGGPFFGTGAWEWVKLTLDRTDGTFTDKSPYTLRLTHNLAVGGKIRLGAIRANFWPYPPV